MHYYTLLLIDENNTNAIEARHLSSSDR